MKNTSKQMTQDLLDRIEMLAGDSSAALMPLGQVPSELMNLRDVGSVPESHSESDTVDQLEARAEADKEERLSKIQDRLTRRYREVYDQELDVLISASGNRIYHMADIGATDHARGLTPDHYAAKQRAYNEWSEGLNLKEIGEREPEAVIYSGSSAIYSRSVTEIDRTPVLIFEKRMSYLCSGDSDLADEVVQAYQNGSPLVTKKLIEGEDDGVKYYYSASFHTIYGVKIDYVFSPESSLYSVGDRPIAELIINTIGRLTAAEIMTDRSLAEYRK